MKLIGNMLCRRRYKVQTKVKRIFWKILKWGKKPLAKTIMFTAAILIFSGIMTGPCYCEALTDQDLRVFEGNVTAVDMNSSILKVKGFEEIAFPITNETKIVHDTRDIRLFDLEIGDYVTVQYYRHGSESRVPYKVIMVSLIYKGNKR